MFYDMRQSLLQDLAIPPLGIYSKDAPPSHKDTCSTMFIEALFVNPETRNNPDVPELKKG